MTYNNEIRLSKSELAFAAEYLRKNWQDPDRHPNNILDSLMREISELRSQRGVMMSAGPFASSDERKAVDAAFKRVDAERARESHLRVQALSFAVNIRDNCDSSDATVSDAEKFYHFLSGRPS